MFILGFVIYLGSIFFAITLLGAAFSNFLNIPSLLIIIVPLLAVLTATRSFAIFGKGLKAMILHKKPLSEEL